MKCYKLVDNILDKAAIPCKKVFLVKDGLKVHYYQSIDLPNSSDESKLVLARHRGNENSINIEGYLKIGSDTKPVCNNEYDLRDFDYVEFEVIDSKERYRIYSTKKRDK